MLLDRYTSEGKERIEGKEEKEGKEGKEGERTNLTWHERLYKIHASMH